MIDNFEEEEGKQLSFTQVYEDVVTAFMESNSLTERREAEKTLVEWRNDKSMLSNILDVIQTTLNSNALFIASSSIEFILSKMTDNLDLQIVSNIFQSLIRRLRSIYLKQPENDNIKAFFYKNRVNIIKCISLIMLYYPNYLELWTELEPNNAKILFCFLFEEEERQIPSKHNDFLDEFNKYDENNVIQILKDSEMSVEWLELLRYGLSKSSKMGKFIPLLPRLEVVPNDPILYPEFISVLQECTSNDYFGFSFNESEVDFFERICDVALNIIKMVLLPPVDSMCVQMASFIFDEIFDFDSDFLIDRATTFGKEALRVFLQSLDTVKYFPDIFVYFRSTDNYIDIIEGSDLLVQPILDILSFIIDLINENPELYMNESLASPFYNVSNSSKQSVVNYFCELLINPSEGAIFAIASSSKQIKDKFANQLVDFMVINSLPASIVFYFIENCCDSCASNINELLQYTTIFKSEENWLHILKAYKSLTKFYPNVIISDETTNHIAFISNIIQFCSHQYNQLNQNGFSEIVIDGITSLLNLIDFSPNSEFSESLKLLITEKLISCSSNLKIMNLFASNSLNSINQARHKGEMQLFLTSLCSDLINAMLSSQFSENDQEEICSFFSSGLDSQIISDTNFILDWIAGSLIFLPIPAHIYLISKIIDNDKSIVLSEKIIAFLLNVGDCGDGDLMKASLEFIKKLAVEEWKPFFQTFTSDFYLAPLASFDMGIVCATLDIITNIVECDECEKDLMKITEAIINGVFTTFQDMETRKTINILIKILNTEKITPNSILDYVCSKLPRMVDEFDDFKDAILTQPFDRVEILKAIVGLRNAM
ncbi:hypothetical protein TRFO_27873 [Tritrichomonas foetus]|uniref:Importin N-terminal domain-containing protein n=1 Tax=Tritrichomonas foetus TaxID=1144522 RepID=A0A1J4K4J7_9EUKA|nr:hypothetical protein TRFO_27873 [Tritrichomonas foetus]|eukprot:OHT04606.1 hypothetical protein TRFO_27873 [Tritrichomonas foetus]